MVSPAYGKAGRVGSLEAGRPRFSRGTRSGTKQRLQSKTNKVTLSREKRRDIIRGRDSADDYPSRKTRIVRTIKSLLKSCSAWLPSRRCELLLYEVLAVLERNAVRTNQILLAQTTPDFIFKLTSGPRLMNGKVAQLYVPDAGEDYIQTIIATRHDFFSIGALERTRKWVKPGTHMVDIGGHIGNHAIFWAGVVGAARIYSFEPVAATFAIQARNIALNELGEVIRTFPVALGEKPGRGRVAIPDAQNMGSVQILQDARGECAVESLDALLAAGTFRESPGISFAKIDVEGFESAVLRGGVNFFAHYKPVIQVEVFERNRDAVFALLQSWGYRLVERSDDHDYVFVHGA